MKAVVGADLRGGEDSQSPERFSQGKSLPRVWCPDPTPGGSHANQHLQRDPDSFLPE